MTKSKKENKIKGNTNAQPMQMSAPDPALKRLEKLVGTWELKGWRPIEGNKSSDNVAYDAVMTRVK